jgi:hypothetical protein
MATKRKRSTTRKRKRSTGKRELLKTRNATFFGKRTAKGRFKEMDERGRSLAADRRRRAKSNSKRGYGDRGDRAA